MERLESRKKMRKRKLRNKILLIIYFLFFGIYANCLYYDLRSEREFQINWFLKDCRWASYDIDQLLKLFHDNEWKIIEKYLSGYLGLVMIYLFVNGYLIYKQSNKIEDLLRLKEELREMRKDIGMRKIHEDSNEKNPGE